MTRAAEVREKVARLDRRGKSPAQIAAEAGVSVARVERLLANMDGPPWDDREDAPKLEPLGRFAPDPAPASPPFGAGAGRRPKADLAPVPLPATRTSPRPAAPDPALRPCGTWAAFVRHRKRGQEPCDPCREAARVHQEAMRRARGAKPRTVAECGTPAGYTAHRRRREPSCQPCKDALAAAQRERYAAKRAAQ